MNPFIPEEIQSDIVLASRSPRRIELLKSIDVPFRIEPAHVDIENRELQCKPEDIPVELARLKAQDISRKFPESIIIGADTVVMIGDKIFAKPAGPEQAGEFMRQLSGRVHKVVTGVAICRSARVLEIIDKAATKVKFRDITRGEIDAYVSSREGTDKAGGYAIQGLAACFVESIEGCYFNVVGLPVSLLCSLLKSISP